MLRVNVANIHPWWLRLALLLAIGAPAFVNLPLYFPTIYSTSLKQIAFWTAYDCFIWLFMFLNVGLKTLLNMLSGAFLLAVTTALLGSGMRKLFPFLSAGMPSATIDTRLAILFFVMIAVIPYGLLFVGSFSARSIIEHLASRGSAGRVLGVHLALALRVLQHVGEVFMKLTVVWSEEHPGFLLPRCRADWNAQWYAKANLFPWLVESMKTWIYACIMHTFEPIPVLVNEIQRIATEKDPP